MDASAHRTLLLALLKPGGGVVLASVVLFLVHPLMDAAVGGGD